MEKCLKRLNKVAKTFQRHSIVEFHRFDAPLRAAGQSLREVITTTALRVDHLLRALPPAHFYSTMEQANTPTNAHALLIAFWKRGELVRRGMVALNSSSNEAHSKLSA